ncbi:transmembrane protein, putative (macronuclear) [Tetrahymena thermophila SB210]|uniref:Transmembrane protein, putative n=1 Tax=Tetrahymena thermophila (strain SB210) TaxID=312017 RepID=W7XC48_TETTS|nr:transmembrane protein, putative [Tetrahymena thermophila SB210]EWS74068.1 transmembrane protein, putative [Tetrahymena thermophila SB210]|eukprot:XP_012653401.1 transmembrane protein, putative [Tetrahymena thermophila SB210]
MENNLFETINIADYTYFIDYWITIYYGIVFQWQLYLVQAGTIQQAYWMMKSILQDNIFNYKYK